MFGRDFHMIELVNVVILLDNKVQIHVRPGMSHNIVIHVKKLFLAEINTTT